MDALRLATLLSRILIALVCLLLVTRTAWAGVYKRAWLVYALSTVVFALSTLSVELFHWGILDKGENEVVSKTVYNLGYVLNVTTTAFVPLFLITVLGRTRGIRVAAVVATGVVLLGAAYPLIVGIVHDWDGLMRTARVLDFVALGGILMVWVLVVLRKAEIDLYLAGLLAIDTLFLLIVPIQEVFFQAAGRIGAREFWLLHQALQLTTCAAQLAIALAVLRLVDRGSILPRLRLGGAL